MAITDKVYVKHHRHIGAQLETHVPRSAFSGATLDVLFSGEGLEALEESTRERVLAFAEDFLDCRCQSNPYCGCPERKFVGYILELRAEGRHPEAIVDAMTDDYLVYAYPGDVRSFLETAIRTLEAAEALAAVEGASERKEAIEAIRTTLEG